MQITYILSTLFMMDFFMSIDLSLLPLPLPLPLPLFLLLFLLPPLPFRLMVFENA